MSKGFENGRVVPVVHGNVGSKWATMPNQERFRQQWLYPVLTTGQSDSMMKTYLEAQWLDELQRRKHIIAKLQARLANLT